MSCNGKANTNDNWNEVVLVNHEAELERILQEEDERKRAIKRAYSERNKDRIKEYHKGRYIQNREKIINVASAYYHANKDSKNEKAVCKECGKTYTHQNQKRHENSKFHQTNKQI